MKRNSFNLKNSSDCYRTIKGVRFEQCTHREEEFAGYKEQFKKEGKRTRIIKGELFVEV